MIFLGFSLAFVAKYELLKPNIAKTHKMALQLQMGSNSSIRLLINSSKIHKAWVFSFLLWCGSSRVWKCYVTPNIGSHHSINPPTREKPVSPPVCEPARSGGGQGLCFPHLIKSEDRGWVHGPRRCICSSCMQAFLRAHASPAFSVSLDSSLHVPLGP